MWTQKAAELWTNKFRGMSGGAGDGGSSGMGVAPRSVSWQSSARTFWGSLRVKVTGGKDCHAHASLQEGPSNWSMKDTAVQMPPGDEKASISAKLSALVSSWPLPPLPSRPTQTMPEPVERPEDHRKPQRHLIVMANGLFGSPANWSFICKQLSAQLDMAEYLLHPSQANQLTATYEGIDTCGERLADEICNVVESYPQLERLSVIGHSMGGLLARYALGVLYDPETKKICGLEPMHFISMATPHLGCDAEGMAQVPFIGWISEFPLLGPQFQRLMQKVAAPTAGAIFRDTGRQFFLSDMEQRQAGPPLLAQMTQDDPVKGRYFFSALASFKSRTCYANTCGDHLVGWANSSLRNLSQLPALPLEPAKAKGVVWEDPLEAAFDPEDWRTLSRQFSAGATAKEERKPSQKTLGPGLPRAHSTSPARALQGLLPTAPIYVAHGEEMARSFSSSREVVQASVSASNLGHTGVQKGILSPGPDDQDGEGCPSRPPVSLASMDQAGQDLEEGLSASRLDHEGCSSRAEYVQQMLHRLQSLPWRRVDVSFKGVIWGFAHNNIQVTRSWMNFAGEAVTRHLAEQLKELERVVNHEVDPSQEARERRAETLEEIMEGELPQEECVEKSAGSRGHKQMT